MMCQAAECLNGRGWLTTGSREPLARVARHRRHVSAELFASEFRANLSMMGGTACDCIDAPWVHPKMGAMASLIRTVSRAGVAFDRWRDVAADWERLQPLQAQSRYYNRICASECLYAGEAEAAIPDAPYHVSAREDADQLLATEHQQPPQRRRLKNLGSHVQRSFLPDRVDFSGHELSARMEAGRVIAMVLAIELQHVVLGDQPYERMFFVHDRHAKRAERRSQYGWR